MSASVSPVKCIRPWNASENSLYQNIKRVCAKVCLNKKGNPQMGYRQTKNKQNDLFDFCVNVIADSSFAVFYKYFITGGPIVKDEFPKRGEQKEQDL